MRVTSPGRAAVADDFDQAGRLRITKDELSTTWALVSTLWDVSSMQSRCLKLFLPSALTTRI